METKKDTCCTPLCKPVTLRYGKPEVVCTIDDSPSFISRFISPHPLTSYMYTNPIPKALFFFIALLVPLITYSAMDTLLPVNGSYGNIEFSGHADVLQGIIDRMGPQQFVTFGFSSALHLCNAVTYASFLTLACVWMRWKLALFKHNLLAIFFDFYAWLQLLECSLYFIQHITLLTMVIQTKAVEPLTNLVYACSVIFLVIIASSVLWIVLAWVYIIIRQIILARRQRKKGNNVLRHGKNNTGIGGIGALPLAANLPDPLEDLELVIAK
jgi:hypothetical protein